MKLNYQDNQTRNVSSETFPFLHCVYIFIKLKIKTNIKVEKVESIG